MSKQCSVEGCGRVSRTKGMCTMHYARLWRTGSIEDPEAAEQRTKHPLYITWMSAKRGRVLCDEWRDDFNRFLTDVSPIPEGKHRLFRIDSDLPYQVGNVRWKPISPGKKEGEDQYEYQKRVQRERKQAPMTSRKWTLKRVYGLTLEQYDEMLKQQNGVCEICKQPETRVDSKTGKTRNLSVDHCHKTRKVRALLCSNCNIGLGKFNDDENLMDAAAAYKRRFKFD